MQKSPETFWRHLVFSLFTNITSDETISICTSCLYRGYLRLPSFPEYIYIHQLMELATKSHWVPHSYGLVTHLSKKLSVIYWPSARANMPLQSDAPEGSDTFQWPVIEKDRVGGFGWWNGTRLMHRKGVTSELYDSYFRLMTIKHAIPKIEWAIEWALNYYITRSRQEVRQLKIRCDRDKMW